MRIAGLLLLLLLVVSVPSPGAALTPAEPQWRTVASLAPVLRRTIDRRLRDADTRERREARVALADVGDGFRVVVLRTPTAGTCGAFIYEIHRLVGDAMVDTPTMTVCSHSLRLGPGNMDGVLDLRLVANEMVAAVWSWTGAAWTPFRLDEEPRSAARRPVTTWDGLARLAGSYDAADLLYFPGVDAALRRILGDRHVTLLANIGVRGPMSLVDDCIVLEGLRPQSGGEEEASVIACPADRSVHAAMLTQGRVVVASTRPRDDPLPARLDDWMRGRLPADPDRDGSGAVVDLRHR